MSDKKKDENDDSSKAKKNKPKSSNLELKWGSMSPNDLPTNLLNVAAVNERILMAILKVRYQKDLIYTLVGDVLVAINPFKAITVDMKQYMGHSEIFQIRKLQPHSYQTAAVAFLNLKLGRGNQSVITSGESGAGKTETTKLILNLLIAASGSSSGSGTKVRDKLLNSNNILELFGNAKTLRNNNSSRFGKWMAIRFDAEYNLLGANVINYLLEKSRITEQGKGERNYHVFYALCKSSKNPKFKFLESLNLSTDCKSYRGIYGGGCDSVETVDDEKEFEGLVTAFKTFKFPDQERNDIFSILAGMLHSANITFSDATVKKPQICEMAAKLFGFKTKQFEKAITTKTIKVMGKETSSPLEAKQCAMARDGINRDIYGRLFDYIVVHINKELIPEVDAEKMKELPMIGSYCWEREIAVYKKEGIKHDHITFTNNDKCCALVDDQKHGIMRLIQDETSMPKGSDTTLAAKLHGQHGKHPNYSKMKANTMQFEIKHFAGKVVYEINGFFEKNLDSVNDVTKTMLAHSSCQMIKQLYKEAVGGGMHSKAGCLGMSFLKSLNKLIKTMNKTTPHFIRCIKPNDAKKPGEWDAKKTHEQIQFGGIFAYLDLRRCGYDVQLTFKQWSMELMYALPRHMPLDEFWKLQAMDQHEACCKKMAPILAKWYRLKKQDIVFGKTMVFMNGTKYGILSFAASHWISKFQRRWRRTHKMNAEKLAKLRAEREREAQRKKEEEEAAQRKAEEEAWRKMEIAAEESAKEQQWNELEEEMKLKLDAMDQEFRKKKEKIMNEMIEAQNERSRGYEKEKQDIRRKIEMEYRRKAVLSSGGNRDRERAKLLRSEKKRQRLNLEVKALTLKREQLEHALRAKITKVQGIKMEIAEIKRSGRKMAKNKSGGIKDRWERGCFGEISKNGGTEFYVNLKKRKKKGFRGMLHFGDRIELLSEKGFANKGHDNRLCCQIKVKSSKNKKFRDKVGYVQLLSTTFYTSRSLNSDF